MDDDREIITDIKFRESKYNLLNNSMHLLIRTTKRDLEFLVNLHWHNGFIYDIKIRGGNKYKYFIGAVLYDCIIDDCSMSFYTNKGMFEVSLSKNHRNRATTPRFKIFQNYKEILDKVIT